MNTIETALDQKRAYEKALQESQSTKISEESLTVLLMHELLKKQSRQEQKYR